MQCVSLQGLAVVFICDSSEGARTPEIYRHREEQDQKRSHTRLDVYVMKKQSLHSFIDDDNAGEQQQASFDEGREILDFLVTVLVISVGGLVRQPDRNPGYNRRNQIEPGMRGLGQNAQAAGGDANKNF